MRLDEVDDVDDVHVLFGGLKCAAGLLLDIGLACGGILPSPPLPRISSSAHQHHTADVRG